MAFALPSAPLLSQASRASTTQTKTTLTAEQLRLEQVFIDQFAPTSLSDWAYVVTSPANTNRFEGTTLKITGFVEAPTDPNQPGDTLRLARFVMGCCAVDAQASIVPVYSPNWLAQLQPDSWVTVEGRMERLSDAGGQLVVIPTKIESVAVPSDPYEYPGR